MRKLLALLLLLAAAPAIAEDRHVGDDLAARTILNFKVADAAVAKLLPAGWEVNPPTSGPTQGFNLSITLIDTLQAQDSEGKPLPLSRVVVLSVPAKRSGTSEAGIVVVDGFTAPSHAPGPYGLYRKAAITMNRRAQADDTGRAVTKEVWEIKAEDGASLAIGLWFNRSEPQRGKVETRIWSAANAGFYRLERADRVVDVVRSIPAGIEHVRRFDFNVAGPKLVALFDGSEQLLSITAMPFYARSIHQPGM